MLRARKTPAGVLPRLELSKDDEDELRTLFDDLEAEVMTSFEEYVYTNSRRLNSARWKPVLSKEDMHVYRERKTFRHGEWAAHASTPDSGSGYSNSDNSNSVTSSQGHPESIYRAMFPTTMEIGPMHAMAASSNMPVLMVTGTAPGTLDDALYGLALTDTPSMRRRSLYQKEKLEDCAVLATMDTPTYDDPFLFRGIVWFLKDYPIINAIVRPRDLLQAMSIRQARTSTGERIGIILYHSISHRDFPEMPDGPLIRVQNSLSVVVRQYDEQRIEIYMSNFVDAMGKVPELFITKDVALALITSANLPNSGLKKKLHWLMRHRQQLRTHSSDRASMGESEPCCVSCDKILGRLFSGNGAVCQLCYKLACSKCRVTKKIAIEFTETSIAIKPFEFCLGCIMTARDTPAAEIARLEHGLGKPVNRWADLESSRSRTLIDLI